MAVATATVVNAGSQRIRIDPSSLIGEGGEAEVYRITADTVLKLFKPCRLGVYDAKLKRLPKFPAEVAAPKEICTDNRGNIVGYTMKFIDGAYHLRSLASKDFRSKSGITTDSVVDLFRKLHHVICLTHGAGIIVGDFNPLNVLIRHDQVHLLDADSMQFAGFLCETFTPRYVDPLLCDPTNTRLTMIAPHSELSDWYSFAVMFFEALLYVHPFGGVFRPANKQDNVPPDLRPLHRISVFHPEVIYPVAAARYQDLPKNVIDYYRDLLTNDIRFEFPLSLLDTLQGKVFLAVQTRTAPTQSGIRCRALFHTEHVLLSVSVQDDRLLYVYHDGQSFRREDGSAILNGTLDPNLHFCINGNKTVVTKDAQSFLIEKGNIEPLSVELFRDKFPAIAANYNATYWTGGGSLWYREGSSQKHVDEVISKQTRIWVGNEFGLGLSNVGQITRAFLFERESSRINVTLPRLDGHIVDAECHFGINVAWLFIKVSANRQTTITYCFCIDRLGTVLAAAQAPDDQDGWLKSSAGKCATTISNAEVLFIVEERNIQQIQVVAGNQFAVTRSYGADAIDITSMHLLWSPEGLVAYDSQSIYVITSN